MNRRTLFTTLATAGVTATTLGFVVAPASAELRSVTAILVGGQQVTVTVDVPPGTPISQIEIPGLPAPIQSVVDHGPVATATPTATPKPAEPATQGDVPSPQAGGGRQETSGSRDERPGTNRGDRGGRTSKPTRRAKPNSQAGAKGVVKEMRDDRRARRKERRRPRQTGQAPAQRTPSGTPTLDNPALSLATPGPAPIGVPNFFIEKFRIPPFLLPIYQAAGIQYGIRWELLAAINEIETDYGRNLNVSSAGAMGWMQFIPSSWKAYGVDANRDGHRDPYNPVDAIFAAARYLKAAGGEKDVRKAVFAYNHADWYVDSVMMRARLIGGLPTNLVGSLTGLTQGRFPVYAKASYADDLSEREMTRRGKKGRNAAYVVESSSTRRGIRVYARRGAPVIATNDGRVLRIGRTERLGRFVQIQDVYGNTFTYARLGRIAERYPAPKPVRTTRAAVRRELELPAKDRKPTAPASVGTERRAKARATTPVKERTPAPRVTASPVKERLFANPSRPNAQRAGGDQQMIERGGEVAGITTARSLSRLFGLDREDILLKDLKVGSRVAAGTILGRIGAPADPRAAPHVLFEIRPAGRGAPRIDPKPILDGWKLLESTAIYRAAGKNPFFGRDAANPTIGQILLMSKETLAERVVNNPRIEIYGCGRRDVLTGQVDRRVLATLEFLAASGLKPTVTSLRCGHSYLTASGNVSAHSSGNAVDIAKVNGIPILGNQGKGSITELTIQRLLTLQGTMEPDQIISLMTFADRPSTMSMADHADHIHVGWQPQFGSNPKLARQAGAALKPEQWIKLIDRLSEIDNPAVRTRPSKGSLKVTKRASRAHRGE
jgi:hypothetical protein